MTQRDDIHLFFPPQWSPFQPFLSTPSLKAYLEPKGFSVRQSDLNVKFYDYFIAPPRLDLARRRLRRYIEKLDENSEHYRARCVLALATLEDYATLYAHVAALRQPETLADIGLFHERIKAFEALLEAFSAAEPFVDIGHSSLDVGDILQSLDSIHDFIENRNANPFLSFFWHYVEKDADWIGNPPRYFGVSIIGTEQILPGLSLCHVLKQVFPQIPIIVGGSVFSRIVEKSAVISTLMRRYLDYVCRYEGEKPLAAFLAADDPRSGTVPNLAFLRDGALVLTELIEPLVVDEAPTPDFDDLPLTAYFAPELVLPILSTRGCYWGKCAFCYHGMIYQDRYRMRDPKLLADDLQTLKKRFGARHFAFNDEALPPKLFRLLPEVVPWGEYFFTGLYKFEKFFRPEHYRDMFNVGFRSLYIGLESASERVQKHMLKNNKQSTMIDNLTFAHQAGIWNHTFNFFGFPTETADEAEETIDFLLSHADIIHSEGTGTFSLEHNAPISTDPDRFGVTSITEIGGDLGLYYDYDVSTGLDAAGAADLLAQFQARRDAAGLYRAGGWIPREFLLLLLSHHPRDHLRAVAGEIEQRSQMSLLKDSLYTIDVETPGGRKFYVVNRKAATISQTNGDAVELLRLLKNTATVGALLALVPDYAAVFPLFDETDARRQLEVVTLDIAAGPAGNTRERKVPASLPS